MKHPWEPTATFPDNRMLSWESQFNQYPTSGEPGLSYFRGDLGQEQYVDCLLYRDGAGQLLGVLNHYPIDLPPYERAGNFNVWVRPEARRQGVATTLLREAMRRYGVDLTQQVYSVSGAAWIRAFLQSDGGRSYGIGLITDNTR